MKFLHSILYLLAAAVISTTASSLGEDDGLQLNARDAEEMPAIYARSVIARDLEHIDVLEKRAEGIWKRAAEAKQNLGTRARRTCSYNCLTSRGRPDDGICVDRGCSHCGGRANNYHCVDY